MSFFEPGDASQTTKTTPSPAEQEMSKFKAMMLGKFLDSMAGTAPSFKSFVQGGSPQRQFPGGFDAGIAQLLQAMGQPGAFTSTSTGTGHGMTPSGLSDLTQAGVLGLLLNQLTGGAIGKGVSSILEPLGGWLHITGPESSDLGDKVPSLAAGDIASVGTGVPYSPYSDLSNILGAADPSSLGPGYGVLADLGLGF